MIREERSGKVDRDGMIERLRARRGRLNTECEHFSRGAGEKVRRSKEESNMT